MLRAVSDMRLSISGGRKPAPSLMYCRVEARRRFDEQSLAALTQGKARNAKDAPKPARVQKPRPQAVSVWERSAIT